MGAFNFNSNAGVGIYEYEDEFDGFENYFSDDEIAKFRSDVSDKVYWKLTEYLDEKKIDEGELSCNTFGDIIRLEHGYYSGFKFYIDYEKIKEKIIEDFEDIAEYKLRQKYGFAYTMYSEVDFKEKAKDELKELSQIKDKLYEMACECSTKLLYEFGFEKGFNEVLTANWCSHNKPITKEMIAEKFGSDEDNSKSVRKRR